MIKNKLRFCMLSVLLILTILLAGCGGSESGSSSTNGTLTLSALTATDRTSGVYNVSASANYAPPAGKVPNGAQIGFTWVATPSGSTTSTSGSATTTLGTTGIGNFSIDVNQTSVPIYITITASMGDLSQSMQTTIPAFDVTLRTTPSLVSFTQVDPDGGQPSVSVALSGGYMPYSIVSNGASSDIEATLTGSAALTISKLVASGTTSTSTYTSIILQDSKGTTATLRVNYFK